MIMYFHLLFGFFLSLVTANLLAATLSSRVPVEILNGSSAAAIQSGGDIRIYYQASENSIHEWKSQAPNSLTYVDTFLVPGFTVKENSPLAAVWESSRSPGEVGAVLRSCIGVAFGMLYMREAPLTCFITSSTFSIASIISPPTIISEGTVRKLQKPTGLTLASTTPNLR